MQVHEADAPRLLRTVARDERRRRRQVEAHAADTRDIVFVEIGVREQRQARDVGDIGFGADIAAPAGLFVIGDTRAKAEVRVDVEGSAETAVEGLVDDVAPLVAGQGFEGHVVEVIFGDGGRAILLLAFDVVTTGSRTDHALRRATIEELRGTAGKARLVRGNTGDRIELQAEIVTDRDRDAGGATVERAIVVAAAEQVEPATDARDRVAIVGIVTELVTGNRHRFLRGAPGGHGQGGDEGRR